MSEEYKKTAMGEIPMSWNVVNSSEIFELVHGYQFRDYDFTQQGLKVLKIGQIKANGKVDLTSCSFFSENRAEEFKENRIINGDVLMALTGATLGKTCIVSGLKEPVYQNYRVGKFEPINGRILSKKYMYFIISSEMILDQVFAKINSGAQGNIGKADFVKIKIPLPPLSEQLKIAEILTTVDEKIDIIDAQVNQTQELKKGLMQQLLTKGIGHTQFKDSPLGKIPESWNLKSFNSIAENVTSRFNHADGRCVELEHIAQNTGVLLGHDKFSNKSSSKNHFRKNDILFGKLRPYLRKFWFAEFEGGCSTELMVFRSNNFSDPKFIFYVIQLESFIENSVSKSFGTKMPRTSWKIVSEFILPVPPVEEQKEIACILTLLDEKIQVLQTKKENYSEIKKGLMQQLLTGKIRVNHLIENETLA